MDGIEPKVYMDPTRKTFEIARIGDESIVTTSTGPANIITGG